MLLGHWTAGSVHSGMTATLAAARRAFKRKRKGSVTERNSGDFQWMAAASAHDFHGAPSAHRSLSSTASL
jgi:hypothetical protein